jgi:hypothetical protein
MFPKVKEEVAPSLCPVFNQALKIFKRLYRRAAAKAYAWLMAP